MEKTIRVLLVEDSENDAELLLRHLQRSGYAVTSSRVDTEQTMLGAIEAEPWEVIISDFIVPGFGGLEALDALKKKGLDLPFIIVSGQIGEDIAVKAMKAGAYDYVMKDSLARLVPAVERALREAEIRRERRQAEERLKDTAEKLFWTVEELRKTEEQLRGRNVELSQARDELEVRVVQRTGALSKANKALRHQIEERKRLEQELLDITEQERRRIAIDLHDDLGQQLTGLAFMVKALHARLEATAPDRAAEADKIHTTVCSAIQRAHDLALDLTSDLDEDNLPLALEHLTRRAKDLFQVDCCLEADSPLPQPPAGSVPHLYKIAQEALTNAIKHGKASRVAVRLAREDENLVLSIWNDGQAFEVDTLPKGRMGLRVMNYRAHVIGGELEVCSDEETGTKVLCSVPLGIEAILNERGAFAIAD